MKSKIVWFITIIICFLLQCTILNLISIGSITPNLMLILTVSMGLMRGREMGRCGPDFSPGLLVDLFYGILIRVLCTDLYVYWFFQLGMPTESIMMMILRYLWCWLLWEIFFIYFAVLWPAIPS